MVDQVAEIKGTARVIAGEDTPFQGVRYRIAVTENVAGEAFSKALSRAEPSVLSAVIALSSCGLGTLCANLS